MKRHRADTGSIMPRGHDTFRVFVSAGMDEHGKRIRKSVTIKGTYKDAERTLRIMQSKIENQGVSSAISLSDWVKRWLEHVERTRAPKTFIEYQRMLTTRILPALGRIRLEELESRHLAQFLMKLASTPHPHHEGTISSNSQLKYYRLLSVILQEAVYQGLLTQNPIRTVRPPRMERFQARFYDHAEIARLWAALLTEPLLTQVVIGTGLLLGVRRGELIGLRWDDIDWQQNLVAIRRSAYKVRGKEQAVKSPKTAGSQRTIPLPTPLREILLRWQQVQCHPELNYICCSETGEWLHIDMPTRIMEIFVRRHRLPPLTLHGLRHTAATVMIEAGVPLCAVSEHLGHGQTSTTVNIYTHATPASRALAGASLQNVITGHSTGTDTDSIPPVTSG